MQQWQESNRARANELARETYARHAEEYATKKRTWRTEHPELSKESNQRNYNNHLETRRRAMRKYAKEHHEQFLNYSSQRRAILRKVKVELVDRKVVFDRDGGICHICKTLVNPNNWHLDHVVPISKDGQHQYNNVAVAHPECNLKKGNRMPDDLGGIGINLEVTRKVMPHDSLYIV